MSLTVLLDLDDTLLSNDMDRFLPVYLKLLGKHMSDKIQPDKLVSTLLSATQKMVENTGGDCTLENAFDQAFYPALGIKKEDIVDQLFDFYENVFPQLKSLTSPKPASRLLVEHLLKNQYQVVIATNPLFPMRAIQHRIEWAGLGEWVHALKLVTSYESFHFSKPKPTYFAEILARLGWPEMPVVMVGNSLEDDILPASQLGIPGFLVSDGPIAQPVQLPALSGSGTLDNVSLWLNEVETQFRYPPTLTRAGLIAALQSTTAVFDTIFSTTQPDQWHLFSASDDWDITEIICHLRDVDHDINLPRIEKVLKVSSPFLAGIVSDTWVQERNYKKQDPLVAFRHFAKKRANLVALLSRLNPDQWKLPAQHAIFGPTSLRELVLFIHTHDHSHIQQALRSIQICKTNV